jgi:tRNA(fMet)-specific endonuclease VapC
MALIVADTDVLIDALRGREPSASRVRAGLRDRSLVTTSISAFELLSGGRTEHERQAVETLLAALSTLPFDDGASEHAASCRVQLEASGQMVGMADYLIAGICLSRALSLLTRNRKHFERMPNLVLADL